MTDKQKRFCDEYLIDFNGSAAAVRAGYSEATSRQKAYELLRDEKIKSYISERKAEIEADLGIDALFVRKRFKEISDRCMTAVPVMIFDGEEWVESGEYKFDSSGANKATEALGKIIGVFEKDNDQKKTEVHVPTKIIFGNGDKTK